jgi:hypothetical protein
MGRKDNENLLPFAVRLHNGGGRVFLLSWRRVCPGSGHAPDAALLSGRNGEPLGLQEAGHIFTCGGIIHKHSQGFRILLRNMSANLEYRFRACQIFAIQDVHHAPSVF